MAEKEQTFTSFTPSQAAAYAAHRGSSYPPPLYSAILAYHTGARETFLDVGTGPGKVVFDLLPFFSGRGVGCDTSPALIAQAELEAEKLGVRGRTTFRVRDGEACADAVHDGTETEEGSSSSSSKGQVDLITVAMAAHWFHLPRFYASAARALRPRGTLAIWTCSSLYCHPSTPHAGEVQAALRELEDGILGPYMLPGNQISRQAYEGLGLPWEFEETEGLFEKEGLVRRDWDREGVPSAEGGEFLMGGKETLEELGASLGSASAVVRWRQANPDKAWTAEDAVVVTMKKLRDLVGEQDIVVAPSMSLLLLRRA